MGQSHTLKNRSYHPPDHPCRSYVRVSCCLKTALCVWLQGSILEPRLGSLGFLGLVAQLLAASQGLLVALVWMAARYTSLLDHYRSMCAIGFSGVLFGLKTVLSYSVDAQQQQHVAGLPIPGKVKQHTAPE